MSSDNTLFDLFDGIRPMARELGERASTVQDWKNHGRIPATKQPLVLIAARRLHLPITAMHIIFPNGVPAGFEEQPDFFPHDAAPDAPTASVVRNGGPIVACDRPAVLHREAMP
jgi:hypothetical protein